MEAPTRPGGSWAVQGCLFGAVALFVVLLIAMVFLAYRRFREETGHPPGGVPATSVIVNPPALLSFHSSVRPGSPAGCA